MKANNPRLKWKSCLAYDSATKLWHARKKIMVTQTRCKVFQKAFHTKAAACQFLDDLTLQITAGINLDPAPSLAAAGQRYLEHLDLMDRNSETVRYYGPKLNRLNAILGDVDLDRITQQHVETYIRTRRAAGVSNGTINKEIKVLATLCTHFNVEQRWKHHRLTHNPATKKVYKPELVRALWEALPIEARIGVGLCLLTGMRQSTAYRADGSWVDGDELRIPADAVKTHEDVRTFLVPTLRNILPTRPGRLITLSEGQMRHRLERASAEAGIDPAITGIGSFRHHCSTYAGECGFSGDTVSEVTNHKTGTVLDRYNLSQRIKLKTEVLTAVEQLVFGEEAAS